MEPLEKQNNQKLTPDMAGYRPAQEWWPDLTAYRKAILLQNITFDEIDMLLKEYENLWSDKKRVVYDFFYTLMPDDTSWVYFEFPSFENVPHYQNFWVYQDLLIWLRQKADKGFCLAIPRNPKQPLFLSVADEKNPRGDSCVGIYADRDFYFEIPGKIFEWGPLPTSAFNYMGYLREAFQFDTRWLPKISQCKWNKTQITLTFSE